MATVLIVDDTAVDRRLAGGLLERLSEVEVSYAENGRQALEAIESRRPDLVVTDLQMPEVDGLELVMTLSQQYPDLPVVLMTAHGSENVAAQALANGAASFVPKNDLANSLVQTVMHVLMIAQTDSRYQKLVDCTTKTDFEFELPNDISLIEPLVEMVKRVAVSQGFAVQNTPVRLAVALEHAVQNAMVRGNLELSRDALPVLEVNACNARAAEAPYCDRKVYFRSLVDAERAVFTVKDDGPGYDHSSLPEVDNPDSFKDGAGRGMVLIQSFMDEVNFNDVGNEITMIKYRSP